MKHLCTMLALCSFILVACQDPVQPTEVQNAQAKVNVEVRTGSGKPLPASMIDWRKLSGQNSGISGSATTGPDGYATLLFNNLSVTRDNFSLTVQPPASSGFSGVVAVQTQLALCSDTNLRFVFDSVRQCGTTDNRDTILIRYCPTDDAASVRECRYYPTNCAAPLDVKVGTTTDPDIKVNATALAPDFKVLEFCVDVQRNPAQSTARDVEVDITATQRGTTQVRFASKVLLRLVPECTSCDCPTGGFNVDTTQSICTGTTADVDLHMSKIKNPITDPNCRIMLDLVRGFSTSELQLQTTSVSVSGGSEFPDVALTVTPQQGRTTAIIDSLTYKIRVITSDGKEKECPELVNLKVVVPITSISCEVRRVPFQKFSMCVSDGTPTEQKFYIKNTGGCPLPWSVGTTSDVYTVSPAQGELQPRDSVWITVSFAVTQQQHDRNPAAATGRDKYKPFNASLVIQGCNVAEVPLNGEARLICEAFKYLCIHQYRSPENPSQLAESIRFPESKIDIEYKNDPNGGTVYDIYIDSIYSNGAGGYTVDVSTGDDQQGLSYGQFQSVANGWTLSPDKNICDTYPPNAPAVCNSMKNGGPGPSTIKGLTTGSVFMYVKGDKCALIWIIEISPDRATTPAVTRVCMEICYPLYSN